MAKKGVNPFAKNLGTAPAAFPMAKSASPKPPTKPGKMAGPAPGVFPGATPKKSSNPFPPAAKPGKPKKGF